MQNNINDFLRNALSGDGENPRVATDALVIPLGRRTTLANARKNFNNLFDRAEKAIGKLIDSQVATAAPTQKAPRSAVSKPKAAKEYKLDSGGEMEKLLGTFIGAGLSIIPAIQGMVKGAFDAIGKGVATLKKKISEGINSVGEWFLKQATDMGEKFKATWHWITDKSTTFVGTLKDYASSAYEKLAKGVGVLRQATTDTIVRFGTAAVNEVVAAFNVIDKHVLPVFSIPVDTVTAVAHTVSNFASSMYTNLRAWLWSLWTGTTGASTGSTGSSDGGGNGGASQQFTGSAPGNGTGANLIDMARRGGNSPAGGNTPTGPLKSFAPGKGGGNKDADARAMYMMDRLIKVHGFTPEAAALSAGNSLQESGVRSDGPSGDPSVPGGSWGMFQWNRERLAHLKAYAAANGKNWQDRDTQIDFHAQDPDRLKTMQRWKTITDLNSGAALSHALEGFGDNSAGTRVSNAQRFLQMYKNAPPQTEQPKPDAAQITVGTPTQRTNGTVVFGDSLGNGVQTSLKAPGDTKIGRNPQGVLDAINGYQGDLHGKHIILSSGASNNVTDVLRLKDQIKALQTLGVDPRNISILGVGDRGDFQRAGLNDTIKKIAGDSGASFVPIDPSIIGGDHVHPKKYGDIAAQANQSNPDAQASAVPDAAVPTASKPVRQAAPIDPYSSGPSSGNSIEEDHGDHSDDHSKNRHLRRPHLMQSQSGLLLINAASYG